MNKVSSITSKSLWVGNYKVFDVKCVRNSWIWKGFSSLGGSKWRSFRAWEVQNGGPGVHIEVQECFWYQRPTMCGPNAGFASVFECIFGVLLESFFMFFLMSHFLWKNMIFRESSFRPDESITFEGQVPIFNVSGAVKMSKKWSGRGPKKRFKKTNENH